MKRKEILEQNISRMVKSAGDSNRPSDAFCDSLVDRAIAELDAPDTDQVQRKRKSFMRIRFLKITAYAAGILVICGIGASVLLQTFTSQSDRGERAINDSDPLYYRLPAKSIEGEESPLVRESRKFAQRLRDQDKPRPMMPKPAMKRIMLAPVMKSKIPPPPMLQKTTSQPASSPSRSPVIGKPYVPSEAPNRHPMAHGGTTPPNAEAYDAMFFKNYGVNPFVDTDDDHLSTFATDVDTGSFTVCRRYLLDGNLPPNDAVRVEEFVNYFDYGYAAPQEDTFRIYAEAAPWSEWTGRQNSYLVRFGLKAMEVSDANRKPAILTFVIDVSGSMNRENRLGLVKKSLRMLVKRLRPKDKIGIAVYGSQGRKVLDHVNVKKKKKILAAIDSLQAGGSTFAEQGIRIGYEMADVAYKEGCINRVILCSDGVANVGRTGHEQILEVIKDKADKGITLSALGFGMGNYNDVLLERLGDKGNGYYAYIDTIDEAKRLFDGNLTGALQVVARDVKIQVDFNPEVVRSYRLIGYENRDVADDKFRDDKEDGGEMGAGHSATALYEIKLWQDKTGPVATTYIRYKDPDTRQVTEFNSQIATADFHESFDEATDAFALAAVVTEFAEVLRKSYWAKDKTLDDVLQRAQQLSKKFEEDTDAIELVDLISRAKKIMPPHSSDKQTGENEDVFVDP